METEGKIPTRVATPAKETKGGTPMKEAKGGNPSSSQMLSLPDLDSKDTGEEWNVQQHKDAWLLDRNFGRWHDRMINKGHAEWNKCDTMICDHADPCKEAKFPDPTSLPLDYMKHHRVCKSRKTLSPQACHPQTVKQIPTEGQGAKASQSSGGIHRGFCLGHLSFARTAHQRQPQAPANGAQDVSWWEGYQEAVLLPAMYVFKQQRHLVHEPHRCGHYHANYRCGQCLNEVFTTE